MFIKNPTKHPIVFMKDVTSRDLEALLDFMYNGEVNVPQSSLGSLIKTAEGLQIKGLAVPDDPPVSKRDKELNRDKRERDSKSLLDNIHSPPPKKPRPRERSPPSSSSHTSQNQANVRSRSPLQSSSSNAGTSNIPPSEANVDEDSRTSVHSGVSGHSEHTSQNNSFKQNFINSNSNQNNERPPSLSSCDNTQLNQSSDEPSPGPSGIKKIPSKEEEMVSNRF